VAVALAVVVFAFSLQNRPGAEHATLAPGQFDGAAAYQTMITLAHADPSRSPGSVSDRAVATDVNNTLSGIGPKHPFAVSTQSFTAATNVGTRTLETVTGLDPGLSSGTIAVIAPRDGSGTASVSGTAVLMQLAQSLSTQSLNRSVELISISGTAGSAGSTELAGQLTRGQVDAAIVIGDLAAKNPSQPVIVPWSDDRLLAPTALRDTLAVALRAQAGLGAGSPGVPAQLARLAFPLTLSPQGPLAAQGIPAVTLSVSGERGPAPGEAVASARIGATGSAVLQAVDALDAGAPIPPPSSYLAFDGKLVPFWAIRLLVLALLLPILLVTVDGLARSRRRGHSILGSTAWVLAAALPFLLGAAVIRVAKLISAIAVAPPGPVGAGVVPLHAGGVITLLAAAIVVVAAFGLLRPLCIRLATALTVGERPRGGDELPVAEGAGPAVLLVACLATLVIWTSNPFAAALVVVALHLWLWVLDTDLQLPRPVSVLLLIIGLIPIGFVIGYYVHAFALTPVDFVWNGTLLIAGGQLGAAEVLEGCLVLGCLASALVIALSARRHQREVPDAITVRGPSGYAGPGSLGGTQSALRR
jgi:hypothetical protein